MPPNWFRCDLPLTGKAVVSRVITDLGVFDVTGDGFRVVEFAPGVDYDDVVDKTAATVTGRPSAPQRRQFRTGPDAELGVDPGEVVLHRLRRHVEFRGDLAV